MDTAEISQGLLMQGGVRKIVGTTALYLRISQDDGNHGESDSIVNQRDLLNAYVNADAVLSAGEVLTFVDDGFTGTNFERPQVKILLDLAKRGRIQNIVVKDLSRWGRNYPEVNEYLDQIFPFLGIRFISVNDGYDSENHKWRTTPMDVAFSSIAYDIYSKELSLKVKQSHLAKALKGEYIAGTTPYGFLRSKTEKNRLVTDNEAACVVQRIFELACMGMSGTKIAGVLNAEGVDSPLEYRRRHGRSTLGIRPSAGRSYWDGSVVLKILRDERYTGTMVYAKTKKILSRSSGVGGRVIKLPEEEWIKVPGTHEAIVSEELFAKARASRCKKITGRKKATMHSSTVSGANCRTGASYPLTAKIVCGYCGRTMTIRKCIRPYYICLSVKRSTGQGCYEGKVYINNIEKILLETVKCEAQKVFDTSSGKHIQMQKTRLFEKNSIATEIKKLTVNTAALKNINVTLYEDFVGGKIGRTAYVSATAANAKNLEETQARIAQLGKQLAEINSNAPLFESTANERILHNILNATELTSEVISLLERVIVFDDEHIEIRFAFSDSRIQ